MLGADPPRRPPHRAGPPSLERSKSCQGPSRRKRNREVLEDITWIVNNDLSSWSNTSTASSGVNDDGVQLGAPVVVHDAGEGETDLDEPEEVSIIPHLSETYL